MSDSSREAYKNRRRAIELAWNKISIREAALMLEEAESSQDSEKLDAARIQLAHLHFRQGRYHKTQKLAVEVLQDAAPNSLWRCDALRMLGNCAAELERVMNFGPRVVNSRHGTESLPK